MLFLLLFAKIGIILGIHKMGSLLTGGVKFWQCGILLSFIFGLMQIPYFLATLAETGMVVYMLLHIGVYTCISLLLTIGFFYGDYKINGRLNTPYFVIGVIVLILVL